MSSVHTPQEKKRLALERDHYAKGKHDKGFRKTWPIKKRKTSRSFRHAADALTRAAVLKPEAEADISVIKQHPLQKRGVSHLGERVAFRLDKRKRRIGAKKQRRLMRKEDAA